MICILFLEFVRFAIAFDTAEMRRMNLVHAWLQKGKQELSDPRSVWDWVKFNVKKYSRQYSMSKSRQRLAVK